MSVIKNNWYKLEPLTDWTYTLHVETIQQENLYEKESFR